MPARKDGKPNAPGQGAKPKPPEAKRNRWVLYVTDSDRTRMEQFAKAEGIDLRKRKAASLQTSTPKDSQETEE